MAPMATGSEPPGGGPKNPRAALDELVAVQISIVTASFNNAAAYTNLIMLGGYASFFGLWQLTGEYLSKEQKLWSALLILISLLLFIAFEVVKMIVTTNGVLKKAAVLRSPQVASDPVRALAALQDVERELERSSKPFMIYWAITTSLCVLTGLAGAAILAFAFLSGLAA